MRSVYGWLLLAAVIGSACAPDVAALRPGDREPAHDAPKPDGEEDQDRIAEDPGDSGTVTPGTFGAPTALVAFGGGASIALRWSSPASPEQIKQHDVYRNGTKIAAVTPGFHPEFPEKNGNGYIDRTIVAGATYEYSVVAIDPQGVASEKSAPLSVVAPSTFSPPPTVAFDCSQATDLEPWTTDVVKPFLDIWYPKIALALALPDYTPASSYPIKFDPSYDGVAYVSGGSMVVAAKYAREHARDLGMFLHESTHVLQRSTGTPGWAVEGIADWTREYILHDRDPVPIGPGHVYTQGYSQGAFFLNWIQDTYQKPIIRLLTIAGYKKTYSDDIFVQQTGKTIPQLWEQLTGQTLRGPSAVRFPGLSNKCVDGAGGPVTLATCNGGKDTQAWTAVVQKDGTMWLKNSKGCLDVKMSGTANGSPVQTYSCNGTGAQTWRHQADGTLINPSSGRCLDDPAASSTDGTGLTLYDCIGGIAQKLELP